MQHVTLNEAERRELSRKISAEKIEKAHRDFNANIEKIEHIKSELLKLKSMPFSQPIPLPNMAFSRPNIIAFLQCEIDIINAENEKLGKFIYQ